jgi:tRNA pseudouridine55 synthase
VTRTTSESPVKQQTAESGLLLIDKPAGITSHDAVDRVRRALGIRKVGHAGTLDPSATGLLLIGVGRATRLLRFLGDLSKDYEGTGVLGVETTTLDAEGEVVRESPVDVTETALREAMATFVGRIEQVPPAYSAAKVGGEKLYRAARAGRTVEAAPRSVEVFAFDLISFKSSRFDFRVRCSSGTYVRSLVADVGARLGCGAHIERLRRTAIGPFSVHEAVAPDQAEPLLPLERAVDHLPSLTLQEEEAKAASHGQCLGPMGIVGPYRAIAPDGGLIGIYRDTGAKSCPDVILAPSA